MMNAIQFSILKWSAWAPGIHGLAQWQQWHKGERHIADSHDTPALKQVPAMLRRRLSRLSKMSLQVIYDCVDNNHQLRTVFCSPHGEIHRTKKLLDDIVAGEAISPMGFSLSVHNTASGLYSIAANNHAPSTAIAAGPDSLESAVIEALAQLHHNHDDPVLVVLADEPLPAFYHRYISSLSPPFALALLIDLPSKSQAVPSVDIALSVPKQQALQAVPCVEPHALTLIRLLTGNRSEYYVDAGRLCWRWSTASDQQGRWSVGHEC